MIELKNVSKSYQDINVLDDINLKFGSSGLACIVGKSGSGKSTLLNLIGLLDKVDNGIIKVNGKDINKFKTKEINEYHNSFVGIVFQNYNLFENMTVLENINLLNDYDNVDDILNKLNIGNLKNELVKNLSGGEKQRVAIARVLVKNPKVILADEPTGALDTKNAEIIMNILKDISKDILVILVSHDNDLVNKYGDYIIHIQDGKVYSKKYNIVDKSIDMNNKNKIKFKKIKKIVKINLKSKNKRNILTVIAFSIGLMSLACVLGIRNGFTKAIDKANQDYLSKYPLYISETSTNLDDELSSIDSSNETLSNKVNATYNNHINNITDNYLNYINKKNNLIECIVYSYVDNNVLIKTYNKFIKKHVTNEAGLNYIDDNESLIILDSNNKIDGNLLKQIGLDKELYNYEDLIGYKYNIGNKEYVIKGVLKINKDYDGILNSGIYYNYVTDELPSEIYLYTSNYMNKVSLSKYLDKYKDIYYTDIASTITNVSKTLMNALSVILICFSIITLIVATIMISILSYISILERIKDIGIYKSMGLSNKYIKLMFYLENGWICFVSGVLSVEFIDFISIFINKVLYKFTGLENILTLNLCNYIFIIILSVILSIIGSCIPLNSIKKYTIVDTLKYE